MSGTTTVDAPGAGEGPEELHPSAPVPAFVPPPGPSHYAAPKTTIDPDRSKTWLRRALPLLMAHKGMFFTALGGSFVGLVLQVFIPQLLSDAIDGPLRTHHGSITPYVVAVFALAVVGTAAGFVSRRLLFSTAYRLEFDLRQNIYEHLTKMSFGFYDRVQAGQLISRANSDIRSVQMYLVFGPSVLVQMSIAAVAFAFMLSISWILALVAMSTMPLVYWVGVRMRSALFPISWLIQARLADVATIVDENINGVRVVKSFAAEQQQLTLLARAADKVRWGYVKDADLRASWTPAVQNLPQVGMALVLLFGGYMVIHGHLQAGAILAFNLWMVMLVAPFMMLGMVIMMGQRAAASAQRIYEILDERPVVVDRPGAVDLVDVRGEVEFRHVDFSYGTENPVPVLHDFDLHLEPGATVAMVGRTGSGKSTVARLLMRFYDVTGGSVTVDGHDVRDVTQTSLRAQVGIVLDEPFLFSESIRDNIAYGRPDASMDEVVAAAQAAGAHRFITNLEQGYDTVVGERGYTLSGGQRQRIAIARTLLVNPPILVLDDATSAIDVQVELAIHDSLRQLMAGRTTLIIAHRLSTISLADRVVLVEGGHVVAEGTHNELMATSPLYNEVLAQVAQEEQAATVAPSDEPTASGTA